MFGKHVTIFLVIAIISNNILPAESGVIIKKIKNTVQNIKNYFSGNEEGEETDFSENVEIKTTTPTYPRIDIRGHEDFDVEITTNIIPTISSRRLIDVGCPEGTIMDRSYKCRPIN